MRKQLVEIIDCMLFRLGKIRILSRRSKRFPCLSPLGPVLVLCLVKVVGVSREEGTTSVQGRE